MGMSNVKDKPDRIKGNTDGTLIGNVGDRLKVDADISGSLPITPGSNAVAGIEFFTEADGNKSMDVNGSGIERVFFVEVPAGQIWYVTELRMFLADNEIKQRNQFGAVNRLNNGFLVEWEIGSTDYQHSNTVDNVELSITFPPYQDNGEQNNNLAAQNDSFYGRDRFQVPVCLQAGDRVKATVRDNLNGLNELYMTAQFWREV